MLISTTELKLKSIIKLIALIILTNRISHQLRETKGFIREERTTRGFLRFCTLSAWENENQMKDFMRTKAHGEAMRVYKKLAHYSRSVHWESDDFPSWKYAWMQMDKKYKGV